jgi:hypothetical protein
MPLQLSFINNAYQLCPPAILRKGFPILTKSAKLRQESGQQAEIQPARYWKVLEEAWREGSFSDLSLPGS